MEKSILTAKRSSNLKGKLKVPGDKSVSHRSLILSSQCLGVTKITGLLESEDVLNTKKSLQKLGVNIEKKNDDYVVDGLGRGCLVEADDVLDFGNSGTGSRLMMGFLAPFKFKTFMTGDDSLRHRPMARVSKPLEKMGAKIEARGGNFLPAMIDGGELMPVEIELTVASAQVKSAILLAGLNTAGTTTVIEKEKTRDHTELMLKYLGAEIEVKENAQGKNVIKLKGQPELRARDIIVPGDPSSAAFLIVAAIITKGSEVLIENVMINPLRIGLFDVLKRMGADLEFLNERVEAGEKIADIRARYSKLKGIDIEAEIAPSMIDEYPILSIAAACAEGTTIMRGLEELKVKESNRFEAIKLGLEKCGINVKAEGDTLEVTGGKAEGGVTVESFGDHRIAMSFLILGLTTEKEISANKTHMIATSFPEFVDLMTKIGAKIL